MGRTRRVTLVEAAQVLGISKEAVRKRIQRGTLPSDVGEDGRRYVYLDAVGGDGGDGPPGGLHGETWPPGGGGRDHDPREELIAVLRDQLEAEREAHAEARRIIAGLVERLPPAIEAPETDVRTSDTAEPRSATEEQQEPTSQPQEEQRSWWRRVFRG